MILALDVGNTNIKLGLFDGKKLASSWRLATDWSKTADEYGLMMMNMFAHKGFSMSDIQGAIISSVIPTVNFTLEHMCKFYFDIKPLMVGPGIKTGINIKYDNPKEVGADRIVNAVSAFYRYGGPCIVIDFGTATSFGIITEKGDFLGGCICPGIKISTDALVQRAAKLPKIELAFPDTIIGRNTVTNMQAGILYGYVGQVEYIVKCLRQVSGYKDARVIATGGMAYLISDHTDCIDKIDPLLTLEGLNLVYQMNIDTKGKGNK